MDSSPYNQLARAVVPSRTEPLAIAFLFSQSPLSATATSGAWYSTRRPSICTNGYTQTTDPQYMLTIVDRGADVLAQAGSIGADQAEALKSEARRRAKAGAFFGHISYISLIADKPS